MPTADREPLVRGDQVAEGGGAGRRASGPNIHSRGAAPRSQEYTWCIRGGGTSSSSHAHDRVRVDAGAIHAGRPALPQPGRGSGQVMLFVK